MDFTMNYTSPPDGHHYINPVALLFYLLMSIAITLRCAPVPANCVIDL